MSRLKDIPRLSLDGSNTSDVLDALSEAVQTSRGFRGDPLDRALTVRDFSSGALYSIIAGLNPGTIVLSGTPIAGGGTTTPDYTPPPTPTGLAVSTGISSLYVQCDAQTYTVGHGHQSTVVYGAKWPTGAAAPTFSSAVVLWEFSGAFSSYASDPATRWCIWIKWKSVDGILSTAPAGGTNGAQATTGQDVSTLLTALSGQITTAQLYRDLSQPIGQLSLDLEALSTLALGAAYSIHKENKERALAILNESENRSAALVLEAQRRAQAILELAQTQGTALTRETELRQTGDDQISRSVTDLSAVVVGNNETTVAALQEEIRVRSNAITAEANARTTLATQILGADGTALTAGLLYTESYNRSQADNSQVLRISGLESSVNTAGSGLLARATALETVTTNVVSGNTALSNRTLALESSVTNPSTGLLARATALETVTTNALSGNSALAFRTSGLESSVNTAGTGLLARATALETVTTSATSGNTALADRSSLLEARVNTPSGTVGNQAYNPTYAALLNEASVRATETGNLFGQYTLKIDLNGFVTGYSLASSVVNGGPTSAFAVRADQFYVAPPTNFSQTATPTGTAVGQLWFNPSTQLTKTWDGSSWQPFTMRLPFVVQTTPTTLNGVVIPAGTYIDSAFIYDLTASIARLGTAWIDDAKVANLSATKLTVGDGTVGGNLKSGNYAPGGLGWLMRPDGFVEFGNALVRGTIYATGGTFSGALVAATGTFAGDISAATGTFSGNLAAGSITTSNLQLGTATGLVALGGSYATANGSSASSVSIRQTMTTRAQPYANANNRLYLAGRVKVDGSSAGVGYLATVAINFYINGTRLGGSPVYEGPLQAVTVGSNTAYRMHTFNPSLMTTGAITTPAVFEVEVIVSFTNASGSTVAPSTSTMNIDPYLFLTENRV